MVALYSKCARYWLKRVAGKVSSSSKMATPGYSSALARSGIHTSVCVCVCVYGVMCVCVWCLSPPRSATPLQVYMLYMYMYPLSVSLSLYVYICMYTSDTFFICMYACMHVCMYVCMYVCFYILDMYVCMYAVCMYVYILALRWYKHSIVTSFVTSSGMRAYWEQAHPTAPPARANWGGQSSVRHIECVLYRMCSL